MSTALEHLDHAALLAMLANCQKDYDLIASNRITLDLSRGKPATDQLSLSNDLENMINGNYRAENGVDARNYGGLRGLPEARQLGADILDVPADAVLAGGNSSLNLMHLVVTCARDTGLWGDQRQWAAADKPTLLAPVPGYDRHFVLSDALGIGLKNIDMTANGPNLKQLRDSVQDPNIKGIWCVPKYSNPTGCTYSDEVVDTIAQLPKIAQADDFVVLWDNAYAVHDLEFPAQPLLSIYDAATHHQTLDHVVQFASTSKITFAGAGIAYLAASETVLSTLESQLSFMTIGPDKVNQLRHARFLKGRVQEHMEKHAELLRPKFDAVLKTLTNELEPLDIATWTVPKGGYFVSLDLKPGLAKQVVAMAKNIGLTLTPAGATYPQEHDPQDKNVRIAPTFAALEDLTPAMEVLTLCVKLAAVKQQLEISP